MSPNQPQTSPQQPYAPQQPYVPYVPQVRSQPFQHTYRMVVSVNGEPIQERLMDATPINPPIRHSVNVKPQLSEYMRMLREVLSDETLTTNAWGYDLPGEYERLSATHRVHPRNTADLDGETVEIRLTIHHNQHVIFDTPRTLHHYNPLCRYSSDLYEVFNYICDSIYGEIVINDRRFMWENHALINHYRYNIMQIKKLTADERRDKLRQIVDGQKN